MTLIPLPLRRGQELEGPGDAFPFLSGAAGCHTGLILIQSVIARKEKRKAKFLNKLIRGATMSLTCQMTVLLVSFLICLLLLHLLLLFFSLPSPSSPIHSLSFSSSHSPLPLSYLLIFSSSFFSFLSFLPPPS